MGWKEVAGELCAEGRADMGVCAIRAEGRQWEHGSGPFSGMSQGIRPGGAAVLHPSPAVLHPSPAAGAPAGNGLSSLAARPPRTEFSGGRSGLQSESPSLFSVLLPFLLLLFPGSGHGRCDALRIQKVQQLCLGNFNAILFELCMQISQLNGLIEENPVVQGRV